MPAVQEHQNEGVKMRCFVMTVVSTAVIGLVVLLSPAAALACSPTSHCYGIAAWNVERKSASGFKGLDAILGINSEALYAWTQEGYYNHISDEEWIVWNGGAYWNESGEVLGCVSIIGCTPEHEDRFFWYERSKTYNNESGAMSPEGNRGPEEWEVTDEYNAATNGWYVRSGPFTGGANGQASWAPILNVGVETTTSSALNSAGAQNLDWEDLQGKWHYSDWSSGSGHAESECDPPARASWITKYTTFGYGVNIEFPCTNEHDAIASAPSAGEPRPNTPPGLGSPPVSSAASAMSPDMAATSELSMSELKTRATAAAASVGEPNPSIEMVKATRARATAVITPEFSWSGETAKEREWLSGSTYAVVLHGHFAAASAAANPQEKPYTALSLVIDAKTGAVSSFELFNASQQQPALDELGAVSAL